MREIKIPINRDQFLRGDQFIVCGETYRFTKTNHQVHLGCVEKRLNTTLAQWEYVCAYNSWNDTVYTYAILGQHVVFQLIFFTNKNMKP
jgi:hypothetical protein